MTPTIWNISIGLLGLAARLCFAQLLHTCSLAEHGRLGKPDFLATAENISAINITLLPNPKHSSYWEEN